MSWTKEQKSVVIAAYLGWTLDAFDFFLMVFVLKDIAAEFSTTVPAVALAITFTLALRPIGALIFGWIADRFGRRPTLIRVDDGKRPSPISRLRFGAAPGWLPQRLPVGVSRVRPFISLRRLARHVIHRCAARVAGPVYAHPSA